MEAAFGLAVVAAMAALLADGVGHLAEAFQRLDPDSRSKSEASATDAADVSVRHREGGLSHRGQRGTHTVPSR